MRDPPPCSLRSPVSFSIFARSTLLTHGGAEAAGRPGRAVRPARPPPPREVVDATHFTIFIQAKHV